MSDLLELYKTMEYGPAPESPAAVQAWLDEHQRKFGQFINNQWVHVEGAATYPSIDPATGEQLAVTSQADQAVVDQAVAAAKSPRGRPVTRANTVMMMPVISRLIKPA